MGSCKVASFEVKFLYQRRNTFQDGFAFEIKGKQKWETVTEELRQHKKETQE